VANETYEIPEEVIEDKRLGRHVQHDPRSRAFPYVEPTPFEELRSVIHRHYGKVFNQGDLGSCTGNSIAQCCNTRPTHIPKTRLLKQNDAVDIYSKATAIDEFDGEYPPEDTGSSGLAVVKVAKVRGLITSYQHAFNIEQAISALQDWPVITGVTWYESMDTPDQDGVVTVDGQIRGGHEFAAIGFHIPSDAEGILDCVVEFLNSWGKEWGHRGRFFMTVKDWANLLEQDGDVTVPIRD
jgi:hypothetical protein